MIPFAQLLALGGRDALEPKQKDFLRSVSKAEAGRVDIAGDPQILANRCIAVIGARKASDIGRRRARQLGRQLAERGVASPAPRN